MPRDCACFRRCARPGHAAASRPWSRSRGRNAKRVLFGAINVRTGHRIVVQRPGEGAPDAQMLLKAIRRCYRHATTIWLLLDEASAHTAAGTRQLATQLSIELVWLPKQW